MAGMTSGEPDAVLAAACSNQDADGVRLALPDVRAMDDTEIARRFPGFDGRWSEQTKRLVKSLGAVGLDLNANWADVPVDWQCKSCLRRKATIVRKNEGGILLAHLHWHHDHLRDHLGALLNERFGIPWMDGVPIASRLAVDHVGPLLERFRETRVCDACNAADGSAKAALRGEVHSRFSFTPTEIYRFVRPRPNTLHEVDVETARLVWGEVRAEFEDRLAFAGSLVERLAAGLLASERGPDAIRAYGRVAADMVFDGDGGRDPAVATYLAWRSRIGIDLLDRSVTRDGVGKSIRPTSGRRARERTARAPTDAEFAAFEARAHAGWRKTPTDWSCPCCGRTKRGTLRVGKSGGWFGQIRIHYGTVLETNEENLRFRSDLYPHHQVALVVGKRRDTFVCSDCGDVTSELQRSRPELGRSVLTLDDIRNCLGEVRDNHKTPIDLAKAAERSEANFSLARAETEFREHSELAVGLWTTFDILGRGRELKPLLVDRARKASIDVEANHGALGWLLRQGRDFVEADRVAEARALESGADT